MLKDIKLRRRIVSAGIGLITLILLIAACVPMFGGKGGKEDTKTGIEYLKQLAGKDPAAVEAQIKEIKKQELKAALMENTSSVWSYFDDAVIMGDSRVVGFYSFGFLPQDQVMAHSGATIRNIPDYMDQLVLKNPSMIFLCYGLNDMGIGFWNSTDEYTAELQSMIELIQTNLPDADIYVNAIIPAQEWAANFTFELRTKPDAYNPVIKEFCQEKGYNYIDCSGLGKQYEDLVEVDGVHFKPAFYEPWAVMMISEVAVE